MKRSERELVTMPFEIPVEIFKEGKFYIVCNYPLHISSYGTTKEEALTMFKENFEIIVNWKNDKKFIK